MHILVNCEAIFIYNIIRKKTFILNKSNFQEDNAFKTTVHIVSLTVEVTSASSVSLALVDVPLLRSCSIDEDAAASSSNVVTEKVNVLSTTPGGQDEEVHRE